jgi:hypothetical protein
LENKSILPAVITLRVLAVCWIAVPPKIRQAVLLCLRLGIRFIKKLIFGFEPLELVRYRAE